MSYPVITLLSDLGDGNASVTNAKALLREQIPGCVIVDISHRIAAYDLRQAAYILKDVWAHFSRGTIHVVLIDMLAGNGMLLAEKNGIQFIAPDNGILPLAFGDEMDRAMLFAKPDQLVSFKDWMSNVALVIKKIFSGDDIPYILDHKINNTRKVMPGMTQGGLDCSIQYIDRYGNVILDLTRGQFEQLVREKPFRIKVMRSDITTISKHYDDVAKDAPLCRFNEAGFLEIALNRSSAAALLGLDANNSASRHYQSIRIFF